MEMIEINDIGQSAKTHTHTHTNVKTDVTCYGVIHVAASLSVIVFCALHDHQVSREVDAPR